MSHRERARDWLFKQTLREPDAHVVDDLVKQFEAVEEERLRGMLDHGVVFSRKESA